MDGWKFWVLIGLLTANLAATVGAAWSRQVVTVGALVGAQADAIGRLTIQAVGLQIQLQQAQQALEAAKAGKK
jgi:hypothetical protein